VRAAKTDGEAVFLSRWLPAGVVEIVHDMVRRFF